MMFINFMQTMYLCNILIPASYIKILEWNQKFRNSQKQPRPIF